MRFPSSNIKFLHPNRKTFFVAFTTFTIVTLFTCLIFVNYDINKVIWGSFGYGYSHYSWEQGSTYRVLFYIVAALIGISLKNLIKKKIELCSKYGKKTLFFYIYHTLILYVVFAIVDKYNLPTTLPYIVLYTVCVVAILHIASHSKFLNFLINPITNGLIKLNILKLPVSTK